MSGRHSNRKSDSFLYPGKIGRKTGFQVTWTPKRGANGLEDPKEFFLSDDEFESENVANTSPAKRLSMRYSKIKELQTKGNLQKALLEAEENGAGNEEDRSARTESAGEDSTRNVGEKRVDTAIVDSDRKALAEQSHRHGAHTAGEKKGAKAKDHGQDGTDEEEETSGRVKAPNAGGRMEGDTQDREIQEDEAAAEHLGHRTSREDAAGEEKGQDGDKEDEEIEEVIKKAEDIGTPIKISRRKLTSLTGSPNPVPSEPTSLRNSLGRNVLNGIRLTKNIALNKTAKNSRFEPQSITNATRYSASGEKNSDAGLFDTVEKIVEESTHRNEDFARKESKSKLRSTPGAKGASAADTDNANDQTATRNRTSVNRQEIESSLTQTIDGGMESNREHQTPSMQDQSSHEISSATVPDNLQTQDRRSNRQQNTPRPFDKDSIPLTNMDESALQPKDQVLKDVSSPAKISLKRKSITTTDIVKRIMPEKTTMNDGPSHRIKRPRKAAQNKPPASKIIISNSPSEDSDISEVENIEHVSSKPKTVTKLTVPKAKVTTEKIPVSSKNKKVQSKRPQVSKEALKSTKTSGNTQVLPVRRSSRNRVPPIASWKNEKIVYKTEKINGVVVKTVEDVVHNYNDDYEIISPSQNAKKKSTKKTVSLIDLSDVSEANIRSGKRKNSQLEKEVESVKSSTRKTGSTKPVETRSKAEEKKAGQINKKKSPEKISKRKAQQALNTKAPNSSVKKQKISNSKTKTKAHHAFTNSANEAHVADNANADSNETDSSMISNPEIEWQTHGDKSLTLSIFEGPGTEKQINRTVAFAPNSYKNVTIIKNEEEYFKVGTLFDQDSEFCGGGVIELPARAKKAVKSNHDTYFIFYVIVGEVQVTLSRNTFVVSEGCSFEIPMGNYYQFFNTGSVTAKMLFIQSKYIVINENETTDSSSGSENDDSDESEE